FKRKDDVATQTARDRAANQVRFVYQQDAGPLVQLRSNLENTLSELSTATSWSAVKPEVWKEFSPPPLPNVEAPTNEENETAFQQFHDAIADKEKLDKVSKAIDSAFAPLEQKGLMEKWTQDHEAGNQNEIYVHPIGSPQFPELVQVPDIL